jgi:cytochrome c oxidase subunit I+III
VLAAVFTAGFFLLLTVQANGPAGVSGVLAVACVLAWLWQTDRPLPMAGVDIGAGIRVPTYATGPSSHGWWAMAVLLTVTAMVFLMAVFSYLFLWSRHPELWIAPPGGLSLYGAVAGWAAMGALALSALHVIGRSRAGPLLAVGLILAATAAGVAAGAADLASWWETGLRPAASGQGAMVFALLAFQGLLLGVAALMAAYAVARLVTGQLTCERRTTSDLIALFIGYSGAQGALAALLVRLFPG